MSYTAATIQRTDTEGTGRVSIWVNYTGDAGEPALLEPVYIAYNDPSPLVSVRQVAYTRLAALNGSIALKGAAQPFVGQILDTTTNPFPTAAASTYGLFMASATVLPGTTPQDVFTITGSATRAVQVVRMSFSTIQGTAGTNLWNLVKRSTANTVGTSSAITAVPTDRAFPAATATVKSYTVNPTAGTLVGALWSAKVPSPVIAAAPGKLETIVFDSRSPVVLTGIGDVLTLNFGGAALPASLSVTANVWWTES